MSAVAATCLNAAEVMVSRVHLDRTLGPGARLLLHQVPGPLSEALAAAVVVGNGWAEVVKA